MFDISLLTNNIKDELEVSLEFDIDKDSLDKARIIRLESAKFIGNINKEDEYYNINGILSGIMYLPDDITLKEVGIPFEIVIDENFGENFSENENNLIILENNIDLISFLWQNIVLEVPSKVKADDSKDISISGDGWRLITSDEYIEGNNLGLEELKTLLDKKEE